MPVVVHVRLTRHVQQISTVPSSGNEEKKKLGERSGKPKRGPLEVGMAGSKLPVVSGGEVRDVRDQGRVPRKAAEQARVKKSELAEIRKKIGRRRPTKLIPPIYTQAGMAQPKRGIARPKLEYCCNSNVAFLFKPRVFHSHLIFNSSNPSLLRNGVCVALRLGSVHSSGQQHSDPRPSSMHPRVCRAMKT